MLYVITRRVFFELERVVDVRLASAPERTAVRNRRARTTARSRLWTIRLQLEIGNFVFGFWSWALGLWSSSFASELLVLIDLDSTDQNPRPKTESQRPRPAT